MRNKADLKALQAFTTAPRIDPMDGWVNWNPKKIWVLSANGLGLKFVFDEVNKLMPDYIKY